jgi:hypothetical protein
LWRNWTQNLIIILIQHPFAINKLFESEKIRSIWFNERIF